MSPRPSSDETADVSDLPNLDDKARVVEAMFDRIAPRYDTLNRLLTFRMDVGWRKTRRPSARSPPRIHASSTSRAAPAICAARSPMPDSIRSAPTSRPACCAPARTDAPLLRADAMQLPFADGTFDGLTCGFALRNFSALAPVLGECARVVRPGGRVALLDVAEPESPLVRRVHGAWFRHVVPFVGGLVSDRAAYRYLPASTAYLPAVPDLLALIVDAGVIDVSRRTLGFGRGATPHGNARMTTSDVSLRSGPRLAARSFTIDGPADLLDRFAADGFAWFDGDHGFVASGAAAFVAAPDAAAFLADHSPRTRRRHRFRRRGSARGRCARVRRIG